MMYKWGHPVATLPSDGSWGYTSLSLNDVHSAKHHPFLGHEPTICLDVRHVRRCSPGRAQWRSRAPSAAGVQRVISFKLMYAQVEYAR
eukprot:6213985-Pleurochrysis_carterae.AAC.4